MAICDNVIYSTFKRLKGIVLTIPSQQSCAKLACRPLTCTQGGGVGGEGVVSESIYYKTEQDSLYCSFNLAHNPHKKVRPVLWLPVWKWLLLCLQMLLDIVYTEQYSTSITMFDNVTAILIYIAINNRQHFSSQ